MTLLGFRKMVLATCVAALACSSALVAGGETAAPAAAATGPACTFSGPAIGPLVVGVTPGQVVNIACTGMPANNPYLLVTTSLLVAIDPAAKPLLMGEATSVPGLLALISALPEMNALSEAFPLSDANGDLHYGYTVPSTQALDPNATCPPPTVQLNSGLIGCAVAMIDLTTFKPVTAGTCLLNYKGQPILPPNPTLAVAPTVAKIGQSVSLSDAPGATTFWWLGTLVSLYASLGGGSGESSVPVIVKLNGRKAITSGAVTPASYSNAVFTPPKLSGSFVAKGRARTKVQVVLSATLLGLSVSNTATTTMKVTR